MMSDKTPTERFAEVTNPIKQRVGDIKTPINRVADTLKRRYSEDAPAGVFLHPGKPEALRPKNEKETQKRSPHPHQSCFHALRLLRHCLSLLCRRSS